MIGAGSPRKFGKEAREVGMRLDAVRLGRLDQRVQAGTRRGARGRLTEEPVLSTDTKWSDRVLDTVGIKRDLRMIEER